MLMGHPEGTSVIGPLLLLNLGHTSYSNESPGTGALSRK